MINHWIVTYDHLENERTSVKSSQFPDDLKYTNMPINFRMYDDDGELYYSGWMMDYGFEPLDDYGMPNAGCTELRYLKNGLWETL